MTVPTTPSSDARALLSSTEACHYLGFQRINDLDLWAAKHGVHAVEGPTSVLRWRKGDLDRALNPSLPASARESSGEWVGLLLLAGLALFAVGGYLVWRWFVR